MMGLGASGANVSLLAKIGTKKMIPLLMIKSSPVDGFLCLNDRINLPNMIRLLASGAVNCLVAKIGTKDIVTSCRVHFILRLGAEGPQQGPKDPSPPQELGGGAR